MRKNAGVLPALQLPVQLFNPDFLRAKGLPVPGWLTREAADIPEVYEG